MDRRKQLRIFLASEKRIADLGIELSSPKPEEFLTHRSRIQGSAIRPVATHIDVELLGRHGTFKAIVEPKRKDALIGAIVLEDLDLVVDCVSQTLLPRDPNRIIAEIE